MSYDWTKFQCNIFIQAPIEKIFNAWMSEKALTTWFLEKVKHIDSNGQTRPAEQHSQISDTYEWKWFGWEYAEKGKILDVIENKELTFSFSQETVQVNLEFIQHQDEVQVLITQSNIPTDEKNRVNVHMGCNLGWSYWLVQLKAWLEHGILLNDRTHREPHAVNQ